jgi:hypothetical protein
MLLAACSQSTHSDEVLLSGDAPVPKDAKYPDFSKPLTSAMDQMTDEEAKKQEAQLAALASRRKSGTISDAEYWRRVNEMRKLKASMPTKPAN